MAPEPTIDDPKRVCVMDASGRLGVALVERLLNKGYAVHAAVKTHDELQVFDQMPKKNLRVFRSDPFDYQSIVEALKGCSALLYSFEPVQQEQDSFDELMAEVEVRAAHNVLEACAQTETIEKVVFTSSVTAVIWREDRQSTTEFQERNWSDVNFCRDYKLWHALSKALAEKTAWALAMDRGLRMVSINAGLLVGPDLTVQNPYLKGAAEMYENGVFVTVDLKFLVDAHVCALESTSSYGRYLCFSHVINRPEDAVKFAKTLSPSKVVSLPTSWEDGKVCQQRISNKKLNKLMIDFKS